MIVKVKCIAYNMSDNPIILLTDVDENRVLPIWVGMFEAHSIALALESQPQTLPLVYDVALNICQTLGANVTSVKISELQDKTFYAELYLLSGENNYLVNVKPSDAIAFALRAGIPINISNSLQERMLDIQEIVEDDVKNTLEILSGDSLVEFKRSLN